MPPLSDGRLMPWPDEAGEPCYLPGSIAQLLEQIENKKIQIGQAALNLSEEILQGSDSVDELRRLALYLTMGLRDALNVAKDRGDRLSGAPEPGASS